MVHPTYPHCEKYVLHKWRCFCAVKSLQLGYCSCKVVVYNYQRQFYQPVQGRVLGTDMRSMEMKASFCGSGGAGQCWCGAADSSGA